MHGNGLLIILYIKVRALSLKLSVLKKTHIWTPFNFLISSNYVFYSEIKKSKYFWDPLKKGPGIRTVATWLHAQVVVYSL